MKNTDPQEIDHGKVYRVKGCPHCGAKPVLKAIGNGFALDCLQHRDFTVRATEYILHWVGSDVPDTPVLEKRTPDAALSELIDDWNDNRDYERLGADRNMLESRQFYEVVLSSRPEPVKTKRSGRLPKGKNRPASAAETAR
ncbi:hypothetical protein AVMA1855_22500 [Acidovorax sp. SUPP1855]|uniref:hypothetical protein n=1 Tax=Acidovorax sp. SUPP1855 TaxID=431774 RepID=UPI0023DE6603|nr:hypothetical protein [Acidovorax sp. SUPP1855]GKS86974.1 hypothetical protein AVMA1855_22500 [Acidovorax sp. SUPP1855]